MINDKFDMSPEGIMELRQIMLHWRNQALAAMYFDVAVVFTHVASHLADYSALVRELQDQKDEEKKEMKGIPHPDIVIMDEAMNMHPDIVNHSTVTGRIEHWEEGDENKAQWHRTDDSGEVVRITATWKDEGK